jgi:hypothetical protein
MQHNLFMVQTNSSYKLIVMKYVYENLGMPITGQGGTIMLHNLGDVTNNRCSTCKLYNY